MYNEQNEVITQTQTKPNIGFIGVGWIGLNRLNAMLKENLITVGSIADASEESLLKAQQVVPDASLYLTLSEVLEEKPEGIVIATPSAFHASQAISALENGVSVFCQKPLARTARETEMVVNAAEKSDKLLGVDFSYRFTEGMQKINQLIKSEAFGEIFAINLVFHNAYGPDKEWFYKPELSGGGCVIDLGSHLIDLALWILDFPEITNVSSSLFSGGKPIALPETETEDFAIATMETVNGTAIQLACSWNLQAGQDAVIEATFYGTKGGATFRNIDGSFFHFEAYKFHQKTKKELLTSQAPDDWGGRAAITWARQLGKGEGFNKEAYQFVKVAEVIDRIYKRGV
jgi:predicted dehydrogenase